MTVASPERHVILGPGGIGGLIGGLLSAGGAQVTLVVRPQSADTYPHMLTVRREGATPIITAVSVASSLRDTDAVDVLWVTTKALQLADALKSTMGSKPRAVVPLLNGVDHIGVLTQYFGAAAVIPATIAVEAERASRGAIIQHSPFLRIAIASRGESRLHASAVIFRSWGADVDFIENETTLLWAKLVYLAPYALTTAASNENIGFVRNSPQWDGRFRAIVDEAVSVANAEGAHLNAAAPLGMYAAMPATAHSSMWRDVANGIEPELDAIGGAVVRGAERHGLSVPVTRELMAMVDTRVRSTHSAERPH